MIAVWAAALVLQFQFPRAYQPQPDRFVLTYAHADGTPAEAMSVPPSTVAACAALPGATEDTYCAEWPTCPAAGTVLTVGVQAEWGEETSTCEDDSCTILCYFRADQPCVCLSVAEVAVPPPSPPAPPPAPVPAPDLPAPVDVALPAPILPHDSPIRNPGPGFVAPTIPTMPALPALGAT